MGSIVSSIWGGISGGHAAGAAANVLAGTDQEVAQRIQDAISQGMTQATGGLTSAQAEIGQGLSRYDQQMNWALNKANPLLADFYNQGVTALSPYMQGGQGAFNQLVNLTQPGSAFMQPFNASMMAQQDPGYQFRLKQGMQALQASGAARGASLGGAALRQSEQLGQGLASSEYENAFNRYMANRQQTFGMLGALANYGQNATNEYLNLGQTTAGRMAGNIMNVGAGTAGAAMEAASTLAPMELGTGQFLANYGLQGQQDVGDWLSQGAQARAAGILGQNQARQQMISGIGQGINALAMGVAGGMGGLPGVASGMSGFGTGMLQGLGMTPMAGMPGGYGGYGMNPWSMQTAPPFNPNAPGSMGGYYPRELTPDQLGAIAGGGAGSVDVAGGGIPMPAATPWPSIFPDIPQYTPGPVGG